MSNLVEQPFDKFWDNPPTRRELQRAINKLSANDTELAAMADTASILINYICEVKLGITSREEVDVYVEAKKLQLDETRAKMKADAEAKVEQPN
jgi:D-serine deaminase-like pyridoxal phosphate-dependent protein